MAERRLPIPADEIDKPERLFLQSCGWLKTAIGPAMWAGFVRGADFFVKTHPGNNLLAISRLLNDNRASITRITDSIITDFKYKGNMRPTLIAFAATATVIGAAYNLDPVALMAFVTKECPKDARLLEREFRRMKGVFQLSPGNIAREYARNPFQEGVAYDIGLIKRQLAETGVTLDFNALRRSSFRDRSFLARNPFGNMLGATLTIFLIMKREGYSVADTYIKTDPWKTIAKRYNSAGYATLYAKTYIDNLKRLREGVSFTGWQPKVALSRLEEDRDKVYRRVRID